MTVFQTYLINNKKCLANEFTVQTKPQKVITKELLLVRKRGAFYLEDIEITR